MLRRTLLKTFGASIGPALACRWADRSDRSNDHTKDDIEASPVEKFLLPETAVNDEYTPAKILWPKGDLKPITENKPITRIRGKAASAAWDANETVSVRSAHRTYAVFREAENELTDGPVPQALLRTKAVYAQSSAQQVTTPPDVHRHEVASVLGDPPTDDFYTDWVDTELSDTRERTQRRTRFWARIPVLMQKSLSSSPQEKINQPYREVALDIATTEWGVLIVEYRVIQPATLKQTAHTAQTAMKYMLDMDEIHPEPTCESFEFTG